MMQKQNQRIEWADLAKFVGIFCMVWGQAGVSPNVDIIIHVFHMPVFFFISGYLFKMERFSLKKKVTSLLVPYFVFGTGLFVIWKLISKMVTLPVDYSVKEFARGLFYDNTIMAPYACIQWFLTCLFLTEIAFYFLKKVCGKDRFVIIILILISITGFVYPKITNIRLFWGADTAFAAITFFRNRILCKKI